MSQNKKNFTNLSATGASGLDGLIRPTIDNVENDVIKKSKRYNIAIEERYHHELKLMAVKRGVKLQALIENALKEYLDKNK